MGVRLNFAKDVSYIAVAKYSGIFINILISAILARMLTPEDFGVTSIATVIIVFFSLFSDMGIGPAVVQNRSLDDNDISNLFGFTFWLGIFLGAIFFLVSPAIARFYDNDLLAPICRLLSLQLLFASLNSVPNALLSKEKKFGIIAIRTLSIQVLCGAISIFAAFKGLGVYSLVITPICSGFFIFCVNEFFLKLKMHLIPSMTSVKKVFSFSSFQFLGGIVSYFGNNLNSLLIGKVISLSQLGYYDKASKLVQSPMSYVSGVVTPVLFPYLAERQSNPEHVYEICHKMNKIFITFAFTIAAVLCMCSKEIILILYGPQWIQAILCFAIMSFIVAMQLSSITVISSLQARGMTKEIFKISLINSCVALICTIIALVTYKTIEAVAIANVISATWSGLFNLYDGYKKGFGKSPKTLFLYMLRFVFYYVAMALAGNAFTHFIAMNVVASLIIKVAFWILLTFLFMKCFTEYDPIYYTKYLYSEFINYLKGRKDNVLEDLTDKEQE